MVGGGQPRFVESLVSKNIAISRIMIMVDNGHANDISNNDSNIRKTIIIVIVIIIGDISHFSNSI